MLIQLRNENNDWIGKEKREHNTIAPTWNGCYNIHANHIDWRTLDVLHSNLTTTEDQSIDYYRFNRMGSIVFDQANTKLPIATTEKTQSAKVNCLFWVLLKSKDVHDLYTNGMLVRDLHVVEIENDEQIWFSSRSHFFYIFFRIFSSAFFIYTQCIRHYEGKCSTSKHFLMRDHG